MCRNKVRIFSATLVQNIDVTFFSNRVFRCSRSLSMAAQCGGQSFASILSNMSVITLNVRSRRIPSSTILLNLNFLLNQPVAKYSLNGRCTNWGLPSTTFITIPVLCFPACTLSKNGCIYAFMFLSCNDSSIVRDSMATRAHFSNSLNMFPSNLQWYYAGVS
jgi:hypothetical protein